ncbi:MAG: methyltransferase [Candidatus Marsarchaeota archaeon]|nr:methyltransferase [Candidatus Marsarchaeota archaeon]
MEIDKIEISGSEEVYAPSEDSYLAAELIAEYLEEHRERKALRVLDMGTGSGILGIFASTFSNVEETVLADISKSALLLAGRNIESNREKISSRITLMRSDLFDSFDAESKFDLIIFNAPYLPHEKNRDKLERSWNGGGGGVEVLEKFLGHAVNFIRSEGELLLVYSSFSDAESLMRCAQALGLQEKSRRTAHIFFEDIMAVRLGKVYKA